MPDVADCLLGLRVRSVLHLGAHHGQERGDYAAMGAERVLWVEADTRHAEHLRGLDVVWCAVSDRCGEAEWNVFSVSACSSLLRQRRPEGAAVLVATRRVQTHTVDCVAAGEAFDLINVDVQGAELLALRGAKGALSRARYVCVELYEDPAYEGQPSEQEIVAALPGYREIARSWCEQWRYWDVLYGKEPNHGVDEPDGAEPVA